MRTNWLRIVLFVVTSAAIGAGLGFGLRPVFDSIVAPPARGAAPGASGIRATVSGDSAPLLSGPEYLFSTIGTLDENAQVTILAKARAGRWVQVQAPDGTTGWMESSWMDLTAELPAVDPPGSVLIHVQTLTTSGDPIYDAAVIMCPAPPDPTPDCASKNLNQDERTGIYLPADGREHWILQSRLTDPDAPFWYFESVTRVALDLAHPPSRPIVFTYEKKTAFIQGKVIDSHGDPAARSLVIARRRDGTHSQITASDQGAYAIPVADGEWQVYVVDTATGARLGRPVPVTVADHHGPTNLILTVP